MKAVTTQSYGSPEVLSITEIDKPVPKNNEVLIKVHASTVNRTDCAILRAKPVFMRLITGLFKPKKKITGTDFAGVVEAVGANVSLFKKGDRVFGFNDMVVGSHAEYMTIPESEPLITIPENITFAQATASIEGTHYGYNMINKVPINAGEKALVNGASGAIGSATAQLLKHFGLEVTAVCGTDGIEKVKALGADKIINYETEDFTKLNDSFDYVFDAVGKTRFSLCKPILKENGIYMSSELGYKNENIWLPFATKFSKQKVIFPFPFDIHRSLKLIRPLLENGTFKPMIDRSFPFENIKEAFYYVESGKKLGNVVLEIQP